LNTATTYVIKLELIIWYYKKKPHKTEHFCNTAPYQNHTGK